MQDISLISPEIEKLKAAKNQPTEAVKKEEIANQFIRHLSFMKKKSDPERYSG